jgi:hypothetical protein
MSDKTMNLSQTTTTQTTPQGTVATHKFEWTTPTVQGEALAPALAAVCGCGCSGSAGAGAGSGRAAQ